VQSRFAQQVLPLVADQDDTTPDSNDDEEDNTPTQPDSEAIQQLLDAYATQLSGPSSTCGYVEAPATVSDGGRFRGIRVFCSNFPDRAVRVQYTDTVANWAQIVDHCDNKLMEESAPDANNMVTRTYVVWGTSGVNTVAFYMPEAVTAPDAFGLALYGAAQAIPAETVCPSDATPDETTPDEETPDEEEPPVDNTANNNAANALATLAESYESQAGTLESETTAAL